MKNFEKWEKEILLIASDYKSFGVKFGKPQKCHDMLCKECDLSFHKTGVEGGCDSKKIKWLYQEYIEKPKLNQCEKNFLELFGVGWIAKDQNLGLYMYAERPVKATTTWDCRFGADINFNKIKKFNPKIKFDFIKWEDEEPWSVEELLKLEVEDK